MGTSIFFKNVYGFNFYDLMELGKIELSNHRNRWLQWAGNRYINRAISYFDMALNHSLNLSQRIESKRMIGTCYGLSKSLPEADNCFRELECMISEQIDASVETSDEHSQLLYKLASVQRDHSIILLHLCRQREAARTIRKAWDYFVSLGDKIDLGVTMSFMGKICWYKTDKNEAIEYFVRADEYLRGSNNKDEAENLRFLARAQPWRIDRLVRLIRIRLS